MPARHLLHVLLVPMLVLAPACGSSGGGPTERTLTFPSVPELDGIVFSNGEVLVVGGGPLVGDSDCITNGVGIRMILCFDISQIPPGSTIVAATLRVPIEGSVGPPPYATHGDLIVDHVTLTGSLGVQHYAGSTVALDIGTLSTNAQTVWKEMGVTGAVQADFAATRTRSAYRLHFSNVDSNSDGECNGLLVNDGADHYQSGRIPSLDVTYVGP